MPMSLSHPYCLTYSKTCTFNKYTFWYTITFKAKGIPYSGYERRMLGYKKDQTMEDPSEADR